MEAIEFKAKASEGIIEIPEEFRDKLHNEVRVIILLETIKEKYIEKPQFTAVKIKTKNFKFNREEANER
ncbi:MAG: hypothetical protein V1872_00795 [bacterium]